MFAAFDRGLVEMKKLKEMFMALLTVTGLALVACEQPRPMAIGTDTSSYGFIAEGDKFGIAVGDARDAARELLLAEGYRFAGTTACGDSSLRNAIACESNDIFDIYSLHRGLGHRTIFLQVEDEHVTKIGWSFVFLQVDS